MKPRRRRLRRLRVKAERGVQSLTSCNKVLYERNGLLVVENLMKNNRMTLQDIANLAGLNRMTVSRYLCDPNQTSQCSRELISKVMEENNYIPNRASEILFNTRSKAIGVLTPSFHNQTFADVLTGIESVTSACRYQTLAASYEYNARREEREVLNLLSYNIDGLILTGKLHTERIIQYVRTSDVPVTELMDIGGQYLDVQVGFNNEKTAFEMTQAFIDSGKRSVAFFGSIDDPRDLSRFRDTERALATQRLETYHLASKTISSVVLGHKMFQQAVTEEPDINAIFCANGDLAVGALLECQAQQYEVPGKMAITSFYGLEIGHAKLQRIASVITPHFEVGKTAADILIKRLDGRDAPGGVNLGYQIYYGDTL